MHLFTSFFILLIEDEESYLLKQSHSFSDQSFCEIPKKGERSVSKTNDNFLTILIDYLR